MNEAIIQSLHYLLIFQSVFIFCTNVTGLSCLRNVSNLIIHIN